MNPWAVVFALLILSLPAHAAEVRQLGPQRAPDRAAGTMKITPPVQEGTLLKCRGGGGIKGINFEMNAPAQHRRLVLRFTRSPQPANAGLEPGQCAWMERGFDMSEPESICHDQVEHLVLMTSHGRHSAFDPPDFWTLMDVHSNSASYLKNVRSPDQYFDLYVQRDGYCLTVKGVAK